MNETQALALGEKVLQDIDFWGDDIENPKAQYFKDGDVALVGEDIPAWMVSYNFASEDFGPEGAVVAVCINDRTGIAKNVSFRNGFINLAYDEDADLYSKAES